MKLLIMLIAIANQEGGESIKMLEGQAAYYSDGVMERTAVNRGLIDSSREYEGWLADNGYIGAVALYRDYEFCRSVFIDWGNAVDGPYVAIDVVSSSDYALGIERNRVIDVDYDTAKRVGFLDGPVNVRIIYSDRNLLDIFSLRGKYVPN